jgi:peptidyl-prolyl cis-trans isomerase D
MFETVQKKKRLIQVVLALIIIPFAFFGLESYTSSMRGSGDDVARVDGVPISQREFDEQLRQQQDRIRAVLGKGFDAGAFDTPEARQALLDSMIGQRLVSSAALGGNLVIGDEALREMILAMPVFRRDGRFDAELYRQLLSAQGMSEPVFEARLRHDAAVSQLSRAIADTAIVSRTAAARQAELEAGRREISEALVPAKPFLERVKVEEAQVRKYYDENSTQFRTPERVRAEYVVLSAEELGRLEAPSESEIKAAYEAKASQYRVEEQRRASHILLKSKDEAEKLLAEVRKAPARFPEAAKKHSQDPGSADRGGDLGFFGRGMMVKPFEDAVFGMKEGEITGPVQTEFGFHVIRLVAVQAGKARPLEEVRGELTAELARQKGQKKFAESAEAFGNLVYEQPDSLRPAAEKLRLEVRRTEWITRGAAPAPLDNPKVQAALFSPDALKARRNTDAIEVAPNVLVAARAAEHQAATQLKFEVVKGEIEALLKGREAARLAREDGAAKLAELQKGGKPALLWSAPRVVGTREAQGLPAEALRGVFGADPRKLPAYVGVARGDEGYAIVRVTRVIAPEARTEAQKAADTVNAQRSAGGEQFGAWVESLRTRAKVEINRASLEKK